MKWMPIETAPREGTWVLLTGGKHDCGGMMYRPDLEEIEGHKVVAAFYSEHSRMWEYAYWDSGWRSAYENPTHWMPLPEPPQ